jgi:hypothetical protein
VLKVDNAEVRAAQVGPAGRAAARARPVRGARTLEALTTCAD